jgi:hypothetical protein
VNLRSLARDDAQVAYGRPDGQYYLDDEEVAFESEATTGRARYLTAEGRETLLCQVRRSVAEVQRSMLTLEGKVTADEQRVLSATLQAAAAAMNEDSGDDVLRSQLAELQRAAGLIGSAMARF